MSLSVKLTTLGSDPIKFLLSADVVAVALENLAGLLFGFFVVEGDAERAFAVVAAVVDAHVLDGDALRCEDDGDGRDCTDFVFDVDGEAVIG